MDVTGGSDSEESACNAKDPGLVPELGRSPGEVTSNPFHYSCLENSLDRGTWRATVHGVTESNTTEQLTLLLFKDNSGRDYFPHFIHLFIRQTFTEPKKIKPVIVSIVSPSICHEVMELDAMTLVF